MTRKDENNRPNNRGDIYTRITDQIIAALEQGIKPWTQPWNALTPLDPSRVRSAITDSPIAVSTS